VGAASLAAGMELFGLLEESAPTDIRALAAAAAADVAAATPRRRRKISLQRIDLGLSLASGKRKMAARKQSRGVERVQRQQSAKDFFI
jgi:hypothetical protein